MAAPSPCVMLSICIPTHHGRCAVLEEALESVAASAAQANARIEVVVSDNASRDGTQEMVAAFARDTPGLDVVYGRNEVDQRLGNIMRVVERATGDWCWLFGSDDTMEPEGIATVLAAIAAHPDATALALDRANFDFAMQERLEADPDRSRPGWRATTTVRSFADIESRLAFQHGYLGVNVVRRERWGAAAAAVGDRAVREHPDWPQLIVFAEMARRHPHWVWLPAVLVRARAGRPYLVEGDGDAPNLLRMHVLLVDGLRHAWREIADGDRALYRALMERSYDVAGSAMVVHHLKLSAVHPPGWDRRVLVSFTRAFWFLPAFRRDALPKLLTPWRLYSRRARTGHDAAPPMEPLDAEDCRTTVTADLPPQWRTREMLRIRCRMANDGPLPLRPGAGAHPVQVAARWLDPDTGEVVHVGLRAVLDGALEPGASTDLVCFVHTPWEPGEYELRITPVQENVRWFDEVDPANGLRRTVQVAAPDLGVAAVAQPSSST